MAEAFSILTDRQGNLSSASDEAQGIIGKSGGEISAKPLFELFSDEDKPKVVAALKAASRTAQSEIPGVHLQTDADNAVLFDLSIEPAGPEKFWVRFSLAQGEPVVTGPVAKESFLTAVAARLGLSGSDEMQMLMIDFDGLRNSDLAARLGTEGVRDVRDRIEGMLTDAAVDGQVGRLALGSYGVLAGADLNAEDVVASAVDAAAKRGINEQELGAKSKSVALDDASGDTSTVRGLLSHVCHKFYETVRNGAEFGAERLSAVSEEVAQAIKLIETALERKDVSVATRDVRMLVSGDVSLRLSHGALVFGDEEVEADRLMVLADHPEICSRHDRAMAVAAVAELPNGSSDAPVIVDIGLPTLESGEAVKIATEMASAGHTVGFRPLGLDMTDKRSSSVNRVYELLKEGIPVWLPNFSAAISKSRQLKGAYVEVSATLLRDLSARPDRNKLLSGLLRVWHDVEVRLVAVNVDSKNLASFVNKLGIAYGIGIAADPAADAPQSSQDSVN